MRVANEAEPHVRVRAVLAEAGVTFVIHRHADCPFPIRQPADFARCLGRPLEAITKSLFVAIAGATGPAAFGVAVCPVPRRVDFGELARHWQATAVRLASRADLAQHLGYPPTGVSPLGVAPHPVVIDESVFDHPTVLVGGGVAGVEVELAPADLQRAAAAARLAFTGR